MQIHKQKCTYKCFIIKQSYTGMNIIMKKKYGNESYINRHTSWHSVCEVPASTDTSGFLDKASDFNRTPIKVYELWSTFVVSLWITFCVIFSTHERYKDDSSGEWRFLFIHIMGKKQATSEFSQHNSGRKLLRVGVQSYILPLVNNLKKPYSLSESK